MDICREMESCSNTWYEGLDSSRNSIYSCHKCNNVNEIPFVVGVLEYDNNYPGLEKFIGTK